MKTGKDIILESCNNIKTNSIDLIEACEDIKRGLAKEYNNEVYLNYLDGHCPSVFSEYPDDKFVSECKVNLINSASYEEQVNQCKICWENALAKEFKEDEYITKEDKIKKLLFSYKLNCLSLASSLDDTEVEEEISENLKKIELEIVNLID